MFNVNAPLLISGGTFQQINSSDHSSTLIEAFRNHVALEATHDTAAPGDPPRCHPKTRLTILRQLSMWVGNDTPTSSLFLWIFGPAGVGKTAIGRSLAEILAKDRQLAATFFFFRTDGQRNNANHFISTLAYQLAFKFPELQPYIAEYIRNNPHTAFNVSMETQLEHLIVLPILRNEEWKHQRAIVVDGLDECDDHDMQSRILLALGGIAFRLAGKLKFLILSRPEYHIDVTFQSLQSEEHPAHFNAMDLKLDLNALDDIRIFTKERFEAIKAKHPLRSKIPPSWPDSADIEKLVWRSSGNFIYPQTVMKYIETTYGRPESRLQVILSLTPTPDRPYGDLDKLYCHILKTVRADINSVLKVLGVLLVLNDSASPSKYQLSPTGTSTESIETILSMQSGDVELLLLDLRSLIALEEKEISESEGAPASSPNQASSKRVQIPRLLHKSFYDFLVDQSRSQEFWIDLPKARITTATGIAKALQRRPLWSDLSQLLLWVLSQDKDNQSLARMVNDDEIGISETSVVAEVLIQAYEFTKNHGWWQGIDFGYLSVYHSLLRLLLKKYHNKDPFIDNILAIISVIPSDDSGTQSLIPIMKCIACIMLFHPSSNVTPSEQLKLFNMIEAQERKNNVTSTNEQSENWHWIRVFTSISKNASGSVSRALQFMAGGALLPNEAHVGIIHGITDGYFFSFLKDHAAEYQVDEEKLQKATLFCLSYVSSRCLDIRRAYLDSAYTSSMKNHFRNMIYLITRLLLVQLYGQSVTRATVPTDIWRSPRINYRLPKKIELSESALELREKLKSFLNTLQQPIDLTASTRTMGNLAAIAKAFIFMLDRDEPIEAGSDTEYDIPCLVRRKRAFEQDSDDWAVTIKPFGTLQLLSRVQRPAWWHAEYKLRPFRTL